VAGLLKPPILLLLGPLAIPLDRGLIDKLLKRAKAFDISHLTCEVFHLSDKLIP